MSGLAAAIIVLFIRPLLLAGVAIYFIQIPYLLTEPMLRVREQFAFTASGRGITSLLTMILAGGWILLSERPESAESLMGMREAVIVTLAGHVGGYGLYYAFLRRFQLASLRWSSIAGALTVRSSWISYWKTILRPGIPLNASSGILSVFNNVPRFIIERHYSASALSVYSLAWQLSQGAMLVLSSLNLVSAIRVGEKMAHSPSGIRAVLWSQLKVTCLAGASGFFVLLAAAGLLSRFVYRDYEDLPLISVIVNSGYLVMNIVGAVSGVLFYERRSWVLNLGYGGATLVCLAACAAAAAAAVWFGWLAAMASAILAALNIWFLVLTFGKVRRIERSTVSVQAGP